MDEAAKWSHDLKMNASKYVDELVNETEYRVAKSLNEIQKLQDSLKAAAKNSSQAQKRADRQRRAQGSAVSSKRAESERKHTENMKRNSQSSYGKKRPSSQYVTEDNDIEVIMPKPSIIDVPLSDTPIVPDEEFFL